MEEIIAAVKVNYPQLFIVAAAFLLMVWLLKKNLFEPLAAIRERRKSDREGLQQEAGTNAEEAARLAEERQKGLLAVRAEAVKAREAAAETARAEARVILGETVDRLGRARAEKEQAFQRELAAAREAMRYDIPAMARRIAEQILDRPLG
jgi:F-type H+-transporting ATPase subunit b